MIFSRIGNPVRPPLPVPMSNVLPHIYMLIGRENDPEESMNTLEFLFDIGAETNTALLRNMIPYCRHYPHHVKAMINSHDGVFAPIPLYGMIGDAPIVQPMSTTLPVLIILYTP